MLPFFNTLVVKKIDIRYDQIDFLLPIISIVLIAGILAGSYPAIVLSKVNPIRALKGATASASQGATLRRALVVFQFVISVVLIVSSLVVYKQINFIQSKSLGYDKENVIIFSARGIKDYDVFKDQVSNVPGVINVSTAGESIIEINNQNDSFSWAGKSEESQVYVRTVSVGYDFIETLGFTLIKGRSFSRELNDTANVIINRKLASLMNVEDPIGLESEQWGVKGKIIGVVEDFHSRSLSENMDPMVLQCYPDWTSRFYIRIEPNKTGKVLTAVGNVWKTINPMYPFEYSFLDSHYERLYKEEHVIGKLALGFTLIAILISSLGLLGLAAYATERKKKEISVRKVLGATVPNLIVLMSTEFLLLASIALLIGCPLAYYFMNSFLAEYTYHTTIGYAVFVVTGVGLLLLTLFVVLLQVAKAAIANPTDNLRNE